MLLFFLPILLYSVFLLICLRAWQRTRYHFTTDSLSVELSVVICARNEENSIRSVLQDVFSQLYRPREIIVVDDGSTDSTADIVRAFVGVKLISTAGVGKKRALYQAVDTATSEYIVCVDADCRMSNGWLGSVASCLYTYSPALLIAPVNMSKAKSFWSQLEALEFMSLVAVTAGAAVAGHPVMSNGANLAFRRNIWLDLFPEIHLEEASGDDMFFLIGCKRHGHSIHYLKSQEAMVTVRGCDTLSQFVAQRRRWISKGKAYSDKEIIILAGVTWSATLVPLLLIPLAWKWACLAWGLKTLVDFCFLNRFAEFFQTKVNVVLVGVLAVIYPLYVVFISVAALFRNGRWK